LDIDKSIEIIRYSDNPQNELMSYFDINEVQAEFILSKPLKQINEKDILKQLKDIEDKEVELDAIKNTIKSQDKMDELIIKDLKETIKKFKQPRRTQIIGREEIQEISNDLLIEDFTTTLVFTQQGYFKKTRKYSETQKVKEDDQLQTIIQCSNKDKAIFISNQGNAYLLNLWEVNEKTPSQLGEFLPNLLPLEKNEIIIGILTTNAYKGYAIYVFENGKIAKIPLSSFETKTNRTKLSNCLTDENGKVLLITQIDSDTDIELADCFSKIKIINTKDINEKKSRNSVGVTAWNCKKSGFKIISAKLLK
jgi:DNA gyrase subunit A